MQPPPNPDAAGRRTVLLVLTFATILKVAWATHSLGSCDVMLFTAFARALNARGLARLYTGSVIFNHTPLTALGIRSLYQAVGGDIFRFSVGLRLVSIAADILLALGLLRLRRKTGSPPWWALALFAMSPVSIMVSGFHGNIDPVMVMLLFFSALGVVEDRPVLCGLFFAAACNVKIVPILVAPVFFFYWLGRGRRPAVEFIASSGALMLAGAAWPLVHCPGAFVRNVFGYGSYWGTWGMTYWLRQSGLKAFAIESYTGLSPAQDRVMLALKIISISGVMLLAWRRRKLGGLDFFTTLGAAFAWIFVFTPGAGVQYMVWFAPFILLLSPRWWVVLTAASAVFMARYYHSGAQYHFPWTYSFPKGPEEFYWGPWMNLVWGTFIALLVCRFGSWMLLHRPAAEAPAAVTPPPSAAGCLSRGR